MTITDIRSRMFQANIALNAARDSYVQAVADSHALKVLSIPITEEFTKAQTSYSERHYNSIRSNTEFFTALMVMDARAK